MKKTKSKKIVFLSILLIGLLLIGVNKLNASTQGFISTSKQDTIKPKTEQRDSLEQVFAKVEIPAQPLAPNKMSDIRRNFQQEFNSMNFQSGGVYKTEISYVVEKDGNVSEVNATGNSEAFNNEAKRAFKKIMTKIKWKPAMIKDQPVRSRYSFPITMSFG